jgi:glycosyltransferase involved in cell wall biosynthesis
LTFLRWLKSQGACEMAVLFPRKGELLDDFAAVAPVQVMEQPAGSPPGQQQLRLPFQPDLIYFNSIASAVRLPLAPPRGCKALCHVHELEYTIRAFIGAGSSAPFFNRFDHFIACSRATSQNLVDNHGIPQERIDVIHEFIVTEAIQARADRAAARKWLRSTLKLPADALVIICVGSVEWRKGSDLFLQLARAVKRRSPGLPVHFVWVGRPIGSADLYRIEHDLKRMPDVQPIAHFVPAQRDVIPYIAGSDVFVLPSREEALGIVCLESAACGTPIVCFDSAGGAVEVVEDDCGMIVPYLDIPAMAEAAVTLLNDPQTREKMGQAGNEKVRRLYDISVLGPRLVQTIETTLKLSVRR